MPARDGFTIIAAVTGLFIFPDFVGSTLGFILTLLTGDVSLYLMYRAAEGK